MKLVTYIESVAVSIEHNVDASTSSGCDRNVLVAEIQTDDAHDVVKVFELV